MRNFCALSFLLLISGTINAEPVENQKQSSPHNVSLLCNFGSHYPTSGCSSLNQSRCRHFWDYCAWDEQKNQCVTLSPDSR